MDARYVIKLQLHCRISAKTTNDDNDKKKKERKKENDNDSDNGDKIKTAIIGKV